MVFGKKTRPPIPPDPKIEHLTTRMVTFSNARLEKTINDGGVTITVAAEVHGAGQPADLLQVCSDAIRRELKEEE